MIKIKTNSQILKHDKNLNIQYNLFTIPTTLIQSISWWFTIPVLGVAWIHGFAQFSFTSHFLLSEIEDVNSQAFIKLNNCQLSSPHCSLENGDAWNIQGDKAYFPLVVILSFWRNFKLA